MTDRRAPNSAVVAHIITGLATGGAERMLLRLLGSARHAGRAKVYSLRDEGTVGPQLRALGIPVRAYGASLSPMLPNVFRRLASDIRRSKPTIIQGWMYHANLFATIVARLVPGCVTAWNIRETVYDLSHEKLLTRAVIRLSAMLSAQPHAIIYNSHLSARQHTALGFAADRAIVIPNGVDTSDFAPSESARSALRRELGLPPDALLVGRFGRYHPMKDFEAFLQVAEIVAPLHENLHFVLAGPGVTSDNVSLAYRAASPRLAGRIRLLGDRSDMPGLLAALDVNCSSSAWGEAFPNVLAEGLSCGVPCVATDVGDTRMIVGDAGIVVPPCNIIAFAHALTTLLELPAATRRSMGAQGRQDMIQRYSLDDIASRYDRLYDTLHDLAIN